MSPDQIATVRKIQIEFFKRVNCHDSYLKPENQVIKAQKDYVVPFVHKKLVESRPPVLALRPSNLRLLCSQS